MVTETESGKRRVVWLPKPIDRKMEEAKENLGMTRSGFLRYCITRFLEDRSFLDADQVENLESEENG